MSRTTQAPRGSEFIGALAREARRRLGQLESRLVVRRTLNARRDRRVAELVARFELLYGPLERFVTEVPSTVARFLTWVPPGHFYSPVPDFAEVRPDGPTDAVDALEGVRLNGERQRSLFAELAPLAREVGFPRHPDPAWRYCSYNPNFPIGDALILAALVRHLKPRRLIEVGSGWSTAAVLDVRERFLEGSLDVTAIEPHPMLLHEVMRSRDEVTIIDRPVQDIPLDLFRGLQANDILFIDDSHVAKYGSDIWHIVTKILPSLAPGVVIHIHDIFWPFEYPYTWLEEGRAWNEAYFVHAFVLFNSDFEILFFNDWFGKPHHDAIEGELPAMLENPGASLWLVRSSASAK
jgi:predicted O-methyltransferase YrrM